MHLRVAFLCPFSLESYALELHGTLGGGEKDHRGVIERFVVDHRGRGFSEELARIVPQGGSGDLFCQATEARFGEDDVEIPNVHPVR